MSSRIGSTTGTPPSGDGLTKDMKLWEDLLTAQEATAKRVASRIALLREQYAEIFDSIWEETPKGKRKRKPTEFEVTRSFLKPHQKSGLEWMLKLFMLDKSGILADEMGLGKTIQTIAYIAALRVLDTYGPHLIVVPKAVVHNWKSEFDRFAPHIPVLVYYGTKEERKALQSQTGMQEWTAPNDVLEAQAAGAESKAPRGNAGSEGPWLHAADAQSKVIITTYDLVKNDHYFLKKFKYSLLVIDEGQKLKNVDGKIRSMLVQIPSVQRILLTGTPLQNNLLELYSLVNFLEPSDFPSAELFKTGFGLDDKSTAATSKAVSHNESAFTSRAGSPSVEDADTTQAAAWESATRKMHNILGTVMLRRLKTEVDLALPLKKEYVLSAPMTREQKELSDAVYSQNLREFLLAKEIKLSPAPKRKPDIVLGDSSDDELAIPSKRHKASTPTTSSSRRTRRSTASAVSSPATSTSSLSRRPSRRSAMKDYSTFTELGDDDDTMDDDEFEHSLVVAAEQERLAKGVPDAEEMARIGAEYETKQARKRIGAMGLSNPLMQLRKVANHPFLFDPKSAPEQDSASRASLLAASGKMLLLDRLLGALFAKGHKVLLFSQFTSMLDIIEDWADSKEMKVYRIDGQTSLDERTRQMTEFNDKKNNVELFLLSTRAGGVGINLTGADTVIFFDSDWNPQQDLQAMDRSHRIGQKKPVLVFRLVTSGSVEERQLERARSKRKLEALIIGGGNFTGDYSQYGEMDLLDTNKKGKRKGVDSLMMSMLVDLAAQKDVFIAHEGDELLTDEQLKTLLDRSDKTMRDISTGQKVSGKVNFAAIEATETLSKSGGHDELDELLRVHEDDGILDEEDD